MKLKYLLLLVIGLMCLGAKVNVAYAEDQKYFVDTLRSERKKNQLKALLEQGPKEFVYKDIKWNGADKEGFKSVELTAVKFNDSMRAMLKNEVVLADAGLTKRLTKLYKLLRPLSVTMDLKLDYKYCTDYNVVRYHLNNIRVWGRKASTKEMDIV